MWRGKISLAQADFEQAEKDFSASLALKQDDAHALWGRSLARAKLGKDQESREDRERAIAIDPSLTFAETTIGKGILKDVRGSDESPEFSPLGRKANR